MSVTTKRIFDETFADRVNEVNLVVAQALSDGEHTDWNDYLLQVVANRYIARLNGVVILDFTDPTPKSFDGAIALQLHSGGNGNMRFKDIYIRDLSQR